MYVQEQDNLMIVVESDDFVKNINNNLKSFYYHHYYVTDQMPKYQFNSLGHKFSMTVGYANDLPYPEERDDLLFYEGEYFYHLEDMLYMVDALGSLKDFKDQNRFRTFDTAYMVRMAEKHEVIYCCVQDKDFKFTDDVFGKLRLMYKSGDDLVDAVSNEVIPKGKLHFFFGLIKLKDINVTVMVLNDLYLINECWSTFHYKDVTAKTCLNYFEPFKFRVMNPIFSGVGKSIGKNNLYVNKDKVQVEFFSFYTIWNWIPVSVMYRHREKLQGLMKTIKVETNLPYRVDEDTFRIIVDTSSLVPYEKAYLRMTMDVGDVFTKGTTRNHKLFHEYVLIKSDNRVIDEVKSPHTSVETLSGKDLPPEGFNIFGR